MGIYSDYTQLPKKRHDYSISEINKKYSKLELSRLILYNLIHNYHPRQYYPDRLCVTCKKK